MVDGNQHTTMSRAEAEQFTSALGQIHAGGWQLSIQAWRLGVPQALGLTHEQWVTDALGGYVRLAVPERREAVKELAEDGLSQRQIADVLGVSHKTVDRDLGVSNDTANDPHDAYVPRGIVSNDTPDDEADDDDTWWDVEEPEPSPPPLPLQVQADKPHVHVAQNSGEHEWYTPPEYIVAARSVLGAIDLDPASSAAANEVVRAGTFYTIDDDGLNQSWSGRVWMNPPYQQPAVDDFCTRLAREYGAGTVTEAIVLVNNATETKWFQEVAAQCTAICFPRGRVKFWHPHKESAPLQGQAVLYLGRDAEAFRAAFVRFGFVTGRAD